MMILSLLHSSGWRGKKRVGISLFVGGVLFSGGICFLDRKAHAAGRGAASGRGDVPPVRSGRWKHFYKRTSQSYPANGNYLQGKLFLHCLGRKQGVCLEGKLCRKLSPRKQQKLVKPLLPKDIHGNDVSLSKYKGKVLLVVNVASK